MFKSEQLGKKKLVLGITAIAVTGGLMLPVLGLTSSASETPSGATTTVAISQEAEGHGECARKGIGLLFGDREEQQAALAAQLGVTVDDLQAAADAVFEQRLTDAVANGDLTQEEADAILAAREDGTKPEGVRGLRLRSGDPDVAQEALAAELGVTVDALQAARDAVFEQQLADAVASGDLTQEQADAILQAREDGVPFPGRRGLHGGEFGELNSGTLQERLDQAVESSRLTQEEADSMLERFESGEFPAPGDGSRLRRGFFRFGGFQHVGGEPDA